MRRVLPGVPHDERSRDSGLGGLRRMVPAGLVGLMGDGRRPAWQRTRLRRLISAVLVATAVWLTITALIPRPAPEGVPMVVVAQDLMAGHVLTADDLEVAHWPVGLRPGGAVTDPTTLVGRSLGAGMSRGEAVTAARVRGPGLLAGVQTGLVAAHVRLADPAMAAMATPGDHVDLISSAGRLVAADVAVLAVDAGPAAAGGLSVAAQSGSSGLPAGVIVAVARDAALRLATVEPSGGLSDHTFSMVMRTPST